MAKRIQAHINPAMLIWAREAARLPLADAAKKIGVSEEHLSECEGGKSKLTFNQLMAAAQAYRRPVSLFYLKEPPKGWQPIQDFRRLQDAAAGFSPALTYAIRLAQERRELALELRDELSEPVADFGLSATVSDDEEELGQRIRDYLGVTAAEQMKWRDKAFDNWRAAIEAKDVFVFMVPRLPIEEMRGVALAERRLPVILVNSKDRTNGRTFTLLHEFCHLATRLSGVSGLDGDKEGGANPRVERFCNAVAASALMPRDWLLSEPLVLKKGAQKTWDDDELQAIALRFGVSTEVVLRRLLTLGRTTQAFYERWRRERPPLVEKKEKTPIKRHVIVLSQLGKSFTRLVFQGYHERRLTLRDVSNYFNMQAGAIPDIERAAFGLKG